MTHSHAILSFALLNYSLLKSVLNYDTTVMFEY